jgi:hypothetical protein
VIDRRNPRSAFHIAVTNLKIEEIWNVVPDGTEIEIVP